MRLGVINPDRPGSHDETPDVLKTQLDGGRIEISHEQGVILVAVLKNQEWLHLAVTITGQFHPQPHGTALAG